MIAIYTIPFEQDFYYMEKCRGYFFDSAIFINYQQHFKTQRTNLPTLIPYFAPV